MQSLATVHLLRVVHVLVGAFWVGSILFMVAFLAPSVRAAGPAGGAVMHQLAEARRLPRWLLTAAILTIVSGIGLYWVDSAGFRSAWLRSGPGRVFGLGGALAILAAILAVVVNFPTQHRLTALAARVQGSGRPPAPEDAAEMQRLQARLGRTTMAVAGLLVLATLAMAVARYVP